MRRRRRREMGERGSCFSNPSTLHFPIARAEFVFYFSFKAFRRVKLDHQCNTRSRVKMWLRYMRVGWLRGACVRACVLTLFRNFCALVLLHKRLSVAERLVFYKWQLNVLRLLTWICTVYVKKLNLSSGIAIRYSNCIYKSLSSIITTLKIHTGWGLLLENRWAW
jgi:hypothetical protein